jgi:hypothetical protein
MDSKVVFLIVILLTSSVSINGWSRSPSLFFGSNSQMFTFKGKILENGRPIPAYLSLEALYNVNGDLVPISLM